VSDGFRVEPLANQDRSGFDCGIEALNRYLREQAGQDMRRRVSNCFLALSATDDIAGYYTFSAASLPLTGLPPDVTQRLPRYRDVPAGLIGRLAVDLGYRRRGIGAGLLADAALKAMQAAPAIFLLCVDAKDENAFDFYKRHAFRPLATLPSRLFLTVATAEKAFRS
jgi:ribosomal protein S18 acetylase RimI-like enzyme